MSVFLLLGSLRLPSFLSVDVCEATFWQVCLRVCVDVIILHRTDTQVLPVGPLR